MCGELYLEGRDGVDGKECPTMQRCLYLSQGEDGWLFSMKEKCFRLTMKKCQFLAKTA